MPQTGSAGAKTAAGAKLSDERHLSVSDVAVRSTGAFFSVLFQQSRATSFPEALEFCERAAIFEEGVIRGRKYYHATFSKTNEQVFIAHSAMRALNGLAGVRIFSGGTEFKGYPQSFYSVLDCYATSCKCADYRAHCHQIVQVDRASDDGESDDFFFPCRYLKRQAGVFELDTRHPASLQDQVQALAVSAGCDWCPRFQISSFRAIDSDVIDV